MTALGTGLPQPAGRSVTEASTPTIDTNVPTAAAFSSDGHTVVMASTDGTLASMFGTRAYVETCPAS